MNSFNLSPAFFLKTGDNSYEPTEATIGPWSAELQHGGPPSALLTHALRVHPSPGTFKITRITIEILGTVPVRPCEIRVEKVRGGKRIELLRGEYLVEGKPVLIAHAWRFEAAPGVSEPVADPFVAPPLPDPQQLKFLPGVSYCPYADSLEWRFTEGGFDRLGPATVWARARIPLIAGQELHGFEALILLIDSANGISAELDINAWTFVPVDMTVGFHRQPVGPWLGMAARTTIGVEGIGQTTTVAFDDTSSVGQSIHTLFVRPR